MWAPAEPHPGTRRDSPAEPHPGARQGSPANLAPPDRYGPQTYPAPPASPAGPPNAPAPQYSAPPQAHQAPPYRPGATAGFPSLSSGAPVSGAGYPGGPTSPAADQYGDWARRQRPQGTVYGSQALATGRSAATNSPLEHSGSLTGHLLSQGSAEPAPKSRTTRVIVIMTVVLSLLVIIGLVVAVFARNALLNLIGG